MKTGFYSRNAAALEARLARALPAAELEALQRRDGRRHAAVALRHAALFLVCGAIGYRFSSPWIWIPAAALQGVNILGFLNLLHEVIHGLVTDRPRPRLSRALARLYALPSAISPTQFERWHLDHHRELGSWTDDPKRAHLSPKRNRRWLKALYFTPALFVIYFRAARREAASYPPELRRRIARERLLAIAVHVVLVGALAALDPGAVLRVWAAPLFLFFPPAFALNRLGQHYDVDPDHVEAWSTRVDGNPLIRFLFLSANHHVEHHWYPGVPLYRLGALNRRLRPLFAELGLRNRGYGALLVDWLVRNRPAHADWRRTGTASAPTAAVQNQ